MDETRNELETLSQKNRAKMARRECLNHGETVPEDEPYRRGMCAACYQEAHRAIKAGLLKWQDLEKKGIAAPATRGGRPKKRSSDTLLDKMIEDAELRAADAAYDKHSPAPGWRKASRRAKKKPQP